MRCFDLSMAKDSSGAVSAPITIKTTQNPPHGLAMPCKIKVAVKSLGRRRFSVTTLVASLFLTSSLLSLNPPPDVDPAQAPP